MTRFYFDGESRPRIAAPLRDLFGGMLRPFGPEFSYVSGTGRNLYYPIPYANSLKITVEEEGESPAALLRDRTSDVPGGDGARILTHRVAIPPGESRSLPAERGERDVYEWSARILDTLETSSWEDPRRAHNAYRFLYWTSNSMARDPSRHHSATSSARRPQMVIPVGYRTTWI